MKALKLKLICQPDSVMLDGTELDDKTLADIAFASKVVQKTSDGLILETSLKMPGSWRLPIEILKRLWE